MGVKGLWDHLPITDRQQSLMGLAIRQGFEANPAGLRAYRLGIDVSLWFYHARKATRQTRNGELQMFFHRCCRLLKAPVLPLFVFDGPDRPTMKRNKMVRLIEDSQLNDIRQLIIAFGFECLTAPGEAEAALSQLNAAGIIDAILSDDVDCFLFGANTVLRSAKSGPTSTYLDTLDVYNIQALKDASFSREELILIALLRGGDYDSGVMGCGITTAVNLRQLGFGERLIRAWDHHYDSLSEYLAFCTVLRDNIKQEFSSNTSGYSDQVNRTAARNITHEFPNYGVLQAYLDPENFHAYELQYVSQHLWNTKLDLSKLTVACRNLFQWAPEFKLFETFQRLVWPGAVLRLLLDIIRNLDAGIQMELPFEVIPVARKPKAHINCVYIRLPTSTFMNDLKRGLSRAHPLYRDTVILPGENDDAIIHMADSNDDPQCFWVHESIITTIVSQRAKLENVPQ